MSMHAFSILIDSRAGVFLESWWLQDLLHSLFGVAALGCVEVSLPSTLVSLRGMVLRLSLGVLPNTVVACFSVPTQLTRANLRF